MVSAGKMRVKENSTVNVEEFKLPNFKLGLTRASLGVKPHSCWRFGNVRAGSSNRAKVPPAYDKQRQVASLRRDFERPQPAFSNSIANADLLSHQMLMHSVPPITYKEIYNMRHSKKKSDMDLK
jgi:hypothetical protein